MWRACRRVCARVIRSKGCERDATKLMVDCDCSWVMAHCWLVHWSIRHNPGISPAGVGPTSRCVRRAGASQAFVLPGRMATNVLGRRRRNCGDRRCTDNRLEATYGPFALDYPDPERRGRGSSPLDVLVIALGFGLLCGVIEAIEAVIPVLTTNVPFWTSGYTSDVVWLAPIANAMIFVVGAILIFGLPALLHRRIPYRIPVFLSVAAALYIGITALRSGLHWTALTLLVIGIATQCARWADRQSSRFRRGMRIATVTVCVLVILTGAVMEVVENSAEEGSTSLRARGLNVVMLILDTVRSADLSVYGYQRPTTPVPRTACA